MDKIRISSERYRSLKQLGMDKYPSISLEKIPTQYGNGGYGAIINDGGYIIFDSVEGKRIFKVITSIFNDINNDIK